MNKPLAADALTTERDVPLHTLGLEVLLARIAEGEAERERERRLPHQQIDLIKKARLGALRLPIEAGGAGSTIRELFAVVIRLAEADANAAHILRNHFSVVERLVRHPRDAQAREWQAAIAGGAIIGLATTELDTPQVGNIKPNTTFTPDGDD
jgi:alkylation response protein AidB-like acyl-CoA dehydrogenase